MNPRPPRTLVLGLAAGLAGLAGGALAQVQLIPIPDHPAYRSFYVRGMSGDGNVVVGYCWTGDNRAKAMAWDRTTGAFDALPEGTPAGDRTFGSSCSFDGSVIVGTCTFPSSQRGFVWRRGVGASLLEPISPGYAWTTGYAISGDGLVYGGDWSPTRRAGLWNSAFEPRAIEGSPETGPAMTVVRLSSDGLTAVGITNSALAFRWREGEGCRLIPPLPGLPLASDLVLTAGGDVIFGSSGNLGVSTPFVWSEETGTVALPGVPGARISIEDATADGRIVVGELIRSGQPTVAMVHTFGVGTVTLASYLNRFGASFADTDFNAALEISDSGDVIRVSGPTIGRRLVILPPLGLADFNADVMTDFHDLTDYLDCFEGLGPLPVSSADLNRDGITDFFDLIEFYDRFGG